MPRSLLLCCCALLTGCQQSEKIQQVWSAPVGRWSGLEVRAVDRWGSWGPNHRLAGQFLEVRCTDQPQTMLIRRSYWPGPEWSGKVVWDLTGITYQPGTRNPHIQPLTFWAKDMAQSLGCLD